MKIEKYQFKSNGKFLVFDFISTGPKGNIFKLIQYTEIHEKNYFNLGFGDKDETTGEINDAVITNNGDSQKILATVASSVYVFTNKYPDVWIYAKGNSPARTRLYRIGITNNLDAIKKDFYLFGLRGNKWLEFRRGTDYQAFLIRRKK